MEEQKTMKNKNNRHRIPVMAEAEVEEVGRKEEGRPEISAEQEIAELKKKLEEKEKEAQETHDRLLRLAADFENYKKRTAREKEDWFKFANEDLIKGILPFIDSLEKALDHSEKTANADTLLEGIKLSLKELLQTLGKFGLTAVESVGKPFDPAFHEAMMAVETDEQEPNRVIEEFRKGYLLNDRLIRPATVSVSKNSGKGGPVTE